jgi:predicted molibdopterin-dependent oxidoreductase YjgC
MCPTIQFIKDNNLIKIEGKLSLNGGRPDHGQLCYKGRFECLKTVRNRLVKPIVRGKGGSWADETLENALDLVAQKLSSVRKAGGTVFGLASGRCAGEELFLFRKLMLEGFSAGCIDALDGDHFRNIVRAKSETGKSFKEASWKEIPEADFILVAGSEDPYQSQPIIATLMHRGVLERGLKVGIIGKTDFMSPWTHVYLSSNRFDELLIIKAFLEEASGIVKSSSKEEKSSVQEALNRIGLDGEACEKFYKMVNAFASARNPLIITGEGITGIKDISGMVNLMNLSILKGPFPGELPRLIILKRDGNSIGAWRLLLSNGNGVVNKENWKCGIMLLGGEEDFDADLLSRLDKLGFLAVISPNFPEALSSRAHVFIPKPHWTEEGGTYVSLDGMELGYKEKALNPPEEVKASWQVMMDLARRIKYKPGVKEWDEIRKKAEEEMRLGSSPIY